MIFDPEEAKNHCDWLLDRGLGLHECAMFLADMELGDSFTLSLLKVFSERKNKMRKLYDKHNSDWNNPITS